jgi:hypothetical protein
MESTASVSAYGSFQVGRLRTRGAVAVSWGFGLGAAIMEAYFGDSEILDIEAEGEEERDADLVAVFDR